MARFKIRYRKRVESQLHRLPKVDVIRIVRRIEALQENPRPPGCVKLTNQDRYRIRQGDYRILYKIYDSELVIWIVEIGHRREVYR